MTEQWRPGQLEAIQRQGGEVIVSASAGTGKTSVVIERAWRLVRSGQANADELLVVTFTEDAAEQLKNRFRARLNEETAKAEQEELRAHLRRQLHRLDRAQISTIHSFCLRVVRENYYRLGLAANASVLVPEQAAVMKQQILDELFEDGYADAKAFGQRFRSLVNRYGGRRVDAGLGSTILAIHGFLGSLAQPEAWINQVRQTAAEYRAKDLDIRKLKAWQVLRARWLAVLTDISGQFQKSRDQVVHQDDAKLQTYLEELIDVVRRRHQWLETEQFEPILADLDTPLPRSPAVRKESPQAAWWPPIKDEIDAGKGRLKPWKEHMHTALSEEGRARLREQGEFLETLMDLVERFSERLATAKESEGRLEFDDLQRLALKILTETGGEEYRRQFKYVLVDEYQDINELQDTIIRLLGRPDETFGKRIANLFMVGDVKQSIYRFRLADPEIFQRLYRMADHGGKSGLGRIDLPDNFRSRREVIDAVNAIFTPILTGGELELEYDAGSRLVCAAQYPVGKADRTAELHVLERQITPGDTDDDENGETSEIAELESTQREAFLVARRIKELLDSKFPVTENGATRPAAPEDVVILLRSLRNVVGSYIAMLRQMGLNACSDQVEAFLEFPEIADIVSLLKVLDNPYQDIDLATVLRSPLVGADLSDLAKLRRTELGHLYDGLVKLIADKPDDPSNNKFTPFLARYKKWRTTAGCACVAELVQEIYLDTAYPEYVRASTPGQYGAENLEQFLQLAWDFSNDGRCDLPHFLSYLELLSEQAGAITGVRGGAGKGVRIQTVHRSKGLEYPVVILAGAGRKVNMKDIRGDILFDRDLGVGMRHVDPEYLTRSETLGELAITQTIRNKTIAEELRLLYVATTRAKEKLIVVGSAKMTSLAKAIRPIVPAESLAPSLVSSWDIPLWWISGGLASNETNRTELLRLLESPDQASGRAGPFHISVYPSAAQTKWAADNQFFGKVNTDVADRLTAVLKGQAKTKPSPEERTEIETIGRNLAWRYAWEDQVTLRPAMAVTRIMELAHRDDPVAKTHWAMEHLEETEKFTFLDAASSPGIEKGKAWHKFLECLAIEDNMDGDGLKRQLDGLVDQKRLTVAQAHMIKPEQVARFFASNPGKIMLAHRADLYRELPFTFLLAAEDFPHGVCPPSIKEPVLVQGMVDCLVCTPDGLVIIDYKTNNIKSAEVNRLVDHYKVQLELYTRALGEILQTRVKAAWLYFTEPDAAVQVI